MTQKSKIKKKNSVSPNEEESYDGFLGFNLCINPSYPEGEISALSQAKTYSNI